MIIQSRFTRLVGPKISEHRARDTLAYSVYVEPMYAIVFLFSPVVIAASFSAGLSRDSQGNILGSSSRS